ncbi:hypothetical protein DB345_21150 [Spartobacteria bacterium LR76]|nr:hypothetical protein DB345_21150 [Spartobacteria bacterium LR76]
MRLIGIAAVVAFAVSGWAESPDFTRPHKFLGFSDDKGALVVWTELVDLRLSDGNTLPLRLRFGGATKGNGSFGPHWSMPLLDSTLVRLNEKRLILSTLGGRTIYLRLLKDGGYSSRDGTYVARMTSDSETILETKGWKLRYVGGKIKDLVTDKGVQVEWIWEGAKFQAIREKTRGDILRFEYAGSDPKPTSIMTTDGRYSLDWQQVPRVVPGAPGTLVAGYDTELARISRLFVDEQFPIELLPSGELQMKYRSLSDPLRDFVWKPGDGAIVSDGEATYQRSGGTETVPLTMVRQFADGTTESYFYNKKIGYSEYKQPDGLTTARSYFLASGPLYLKIRELTQSRDGREILVQKWSYDEAGRLIRERLGKSLKEWTYGPEGGLISYRESLGDKVLYSELYDQSGRIAERVRKGDTFKYSYQAGEILVDWYQGEKLIAQVSRDPRTGLERTLVQDPQTKQLKVEREFMPLTKAVSEAQRAIQQNLPGTMPIIK